MNPLPSPGGEAADPLPRRNAFLIDSEQLQSGDALLDTPG